LTEERETTDRLGNGSDKERVGGVREREPSSRGKDWGGEHTDVPSKTGKSMEKGNQLWLR